ncbi:MAG: hypothetical protein ACLFN0_10440 [Thermovirgaceae bacterium]
MLSLMCPGPRGITVVGDAGCIIERVCGGFEVEEREIRTAKDRITAEKALLFVSNRKRPKTLRFFVTGTTPEEILADAISSGWSHCIHAVKIHPRNIIMRLYGDPLPVISQLELELPSSRDGFQKLLWRSSDRGVALCFTQKPLNRPLSSADVFEEILLVDRPFDELYARLEARALDLFNESIGRRDWTEMEIRIYDAYDDYAPHIERLRIALRSLQIGLNLGEGWGKDHARILMPIQIYRVRILTFVAPEDLKKVLVGLEHTKKGERFVDMDLFVKGRKFSWTSLQEEAPQGRTELGAQFHFDLYGKLTEEEKEHIERLEQEVLAARAVNGQGKCHG